ncbi:winged helix-turn-helix domain-containing protein [Marinicella sp. W31]|uniref:winged helix-turn-helix domain-containing protein n=1 Tax=Marinicella sp. W31 TaxID=3023713 RepID=UPI003757F035
MQQPECLVIDQWLADRKANTLSAGSVTKKIEPKTMDLLFLLLSKPGQVLSKDEIMRAIWSDTVVGEDTLARAVSMLRKAFEDNAKQPRYIQTIPKRGYRFLKSPRAVTHQKHNTHPIYWLLGAAAAIVIVLLWPKGELPIENTSNQQAERLTQLADDFYYQFKRADNEAAINLYERVIADAPNYAPSQSGLANALVQKVLRWPNPINTPDINHKKLIDAIQQGRNKTPQAKQYLSRAQALAERASRLAPDDPYSYRALGLVYAVQEDYTAAKDAYQKALALDPQSWEVLVNMSDLLQIEGNDLEALNHLEKAHEAMKQRYHSKPTQIRPWQAKLAVAIGQQYEKLGQLQEAEIWYRQVLSYSPYHPEATVALTHILAANGETLQAQQLCQQLRQKTESMTDCSY